MRILGALAMALTAGIGKRFGQLCEDSCRADFCCWHLADLHRHAEHDH